MNEAMNGLLMNEFTTALSSLSLSFPADDDYTTTDHVDEDVDVGGRFFSSFLPLLVKS